MPARVTENRLSRVVESSVNDCKTAIYVLDPKKSQILSALNGADGWPNLVQRQLLVNCALILIQTELLDETQLVWNVCNELQACQVVHLDLATVCSKHQLVIGDPDLSENYSFSLNCADELALRIKNQKLAVFAQNDEKAS